MIEVVLLGFGNLNQHLFEGLYTAENVAVKQVFNRTPISNKNIFKNVNFTNNLSTLVEADIYIIGIPDDAIAAFSNSLPLKDKLVVHTSGGVSMDQLAGKNRRGVFYPLQSFSKTRRVNFRTIPICIEAEDKKDLELLFRLGTGIADVVVEIPSEKRAKLHLAAVFVNNFVNHLYHVGSEILGEENLPFSLLKPLILETALKIEHLSPQKAQTGPAKRRDFKTIEKHLHLLKDNSHKEIYQLFTQALGNKEWE